MARPGASKGGRALSGGLARFELANTCHCARVAELADAPDSKSGGTQKRPCFLRVLVGQSEGQFESFQFRAKCNGPNGLSNDLTHIQNLESYHWTTSQQYEKSGLTSCRAC